MTETALDRRFCNALLQLPRQYRNRYDTDAHHELLRILFTALAGWNSDYLDHFFPKGHPTLTGTPWILSNAQGARQGAEYTEAARGRRCGHIFKNGEATYCCRTCTADDTCVLCTRCFEASDHEGHQVYVSMSLGTTGCCDCGDEEAFNKPINCTIHTPRSRSSLGGGYGAEGDAETTAQIPEDLKRSIRRTISRALDYVCDVFSCAAEHMRLPKTEEAIRKNEESSRLSSEWPGGPGYGGSEDSEQDNEFAMVLWNDEKHTVEEVKEQIAKACRQTRNFGLSKAKEIDEVGRSVVEYSRNLGELLHRARIIEQIKLTVTIRSSRDTFREEMCGTIISWLSDISGCSVAGDHHFLITIVCEEMLKSWRIGSQAFNLQVGGKGIRDHQKSEDRLHQLSNMNLQRRIRLADRINQLQRRRAADDQDRRATHRAAVAATNEAEDETMQEADEHALSEVEVEDEMELEDVLAMGEDLDEDEAEAEVDNEDEQPETTRIINETALLPDLMTLIAGPITPGPDPNTTVDRSSDDSPEEDNTLVIQRDPNRLLGAIPVTPNNYKSSGTPAPRYWYEKQRSWNESPSSKGRPIYEDLNQRIRVDFLILYDLRMWKKLRNSLRHLYISTVVTIPVFKRILGLRFAALYTWLAQLYLIADREPDHSIINLSLQMLTTPSITAEIVDRGQFFTRLLAILYTFLTRRQVGHPEEVDPLAMIAFDAGVMTNRRILHFFNDMKYLLDSKHVQRKLRDEDDYLLQFIDFVKLYQGICPNTRAVNEHVEYESDTWISASIIARDVTRMSRQFCESFKWTRTEDPSGICRAIRQTAKAAIINSLGLERDRFTEAEIKRETTFITRRYFRLGVSADPHSPPVQHFLIPEFIVDAEPMSFHHALHYTLSWLIDSGKSMSSSQLKSLLHFSQPQLEIQDPRSPIKFVVPRHHASQYMLALFDIPLRVCVWLSQMKTGLWVRNGMTLRHQMSTFRSVGQRDVAHQRDLFLLQTAFVVCEPAEFLVSIIDRFGLLPYMDLNFEKRDGYEDSHMVDLAEDFIHLLVILLSDRSLLIPHEDEPQPHKLLAKRDIIHVLCFKPMSFSELTTRLPDKVQELDDFAEILGEVTVFRAPEGLSDSGSYELKEQYHSEIDPYHAYYSKNQREEAETVFRTHIAKKTGKAIEEIVYEPQLQPIRSGIFVELAAFTKTDIFAQVIYFALHWVWISPRQDGRLPGTRVESFLQIVLHLMLLAILEESETDRSSGASPGMASSFSETVLLMVRQYSNPPGPTMFEYLVRLSHDDCFKASHAKIRAVLYRLQVKAPSHHTTALARLPHDAQTALNQTIVPDHEKDLLLKRRQALERKERVMASFRQQQTEFMEQQGSQMIDWGIDHDSDVDDELDVTPGGKPEKTWIFPEGTCIFCQEETNDQSLYGTLAFMGASNIHRLTDLKDEDYITEVCITPYNLDRSADAIRPFGVASHNIQQVPRVGSDGFTAMHERRGLGKGFPPCQHRRGPVATSCGHIMHFSCFENYNASTQRRHGVQVARNHPERLHLKEFVCPLCKALGNAFLPIVWKPKRLTPPETLQSDDFDDWIALSDKTSVVRKLEPATYQETFVEYARATFVPSVIGQLPELNRLLASSPAPSSTEAPAPLTRPGWLAERLLSVAEARGGFMATLPGSATQRSSSVGQGSRTNTPGLVKAHERLVDTLRLNQLGDDSGSQHSRSLFSFNADLPAEIVGNTIAAIEIAQRGIESDGNIFIHKISDQSVTHLRVLSETALSWTVLGALHCYEPSGGRTIGAQAFWREMRELTARQLQQLLAFGPSTGQTTALLDQDVFVFLTSCSFYMVPACSMDFQHVMRLCYTAEIVKVIVAYLCDGETALHYAHNDNAIAERLDPRSLEVFRRKLRTTSESFSNFSQFVGNIIRQCRSNMGSGDGVLGTLSTNPNARYRFDQFLHLAVTSYALPFVRKCALLLHVRFGADFTASSYTANPDDVELTRLSRMIGLPTVDELVAGMVSDTPTSQSLRVLSLAWIDDICSQYGPHRGTAQAGLQLAHPAIYELVALPDTHDVLNAEAMSRRCPSTGAELGDPCVCLFCGQLFCGQSSCCSRQTAWGTEGGCFQHQAKCGGSVGMYLNIRKCAVLFLNGRNGGWSTAPYLDRHGEVDPGLRRKHQLFLNRKRYDKLFRDVWLAQGIPNFISRKLEADVNTGGWETT